MLDKLQVTAKILLKLDSNSSLLLEYSNNCFKTKTYKIITQETLYNMAPVGRDKVS